MTLAVVGIGLVSPFASTLREHVFFLRAGVPAPPPSPFRGPKDERLDVAFCRWIGPRAPIAERLSAMATRALGDATAPLAGKIQPRDAKTLLCTSVPRPGLTTEDAHALSAQLRPTSVYAGDAGAFAALKEAQSLLASGQALAAILVATDSFVSLDALVQHVKFPPSPWSMTPQALSEGAAAVALMDAREAKRAGIPILGIIEGVATALGRSNDDNLEPVDGGAMAVAIRELPAQGRVRSAFGSWNVDSLRHNEWQLAVARMCDRFDANVEYACLESRIGRVGAAAGLMNLGYGFGVLRHGAAEAVETSGAPFVAWAISPDGTRGVARATTRTP